MKAQSADKKSSYLPKRAHKERDLQVQRFPSLCLNNRRYKFINRYGSDDTFVLPSGVLKLTVVVMVSVVFLLTHLWGV